MDKKKNSLLKKSFVVTAIVITALLAILYGLGWYLSPQDKLEHADAIVVISGGETDSRVKEGVTLYRSGYAPVMILSGAAYSGTVSNAKTMRREALALGVPADKIITEDSAQDTVGNAVYTKAIVSTLNAHSIILVTSPYHQRRASIIFHYNYPPDVRIINHSAKDSAWRRAGWWWNSWAGELTFEETVKIGYLYLRPSARGTIAR